MSTALLLLSFGGPEGPDDVLPFLRNVVKGRNVPDDRLAEVAAQYERFGGVSPINQQNRSLKSAIEESFISNRLDIPVYWGNRNWTPYLNQTVQQMVDDGVTKAYVFVTSAFGSYSGCRQYRENLIAAADAVAGAGIELQKLRLYYNHPGFCEPAAERLRDAVERHASTHGEPNPHVVFTAHSIPLSMAASCDYEAQLREAAEIVTELAGTTTEWDLVFQSRSGPPQVPWLEPDIVDHLIDLHGQSVDDVVVVPLGFVSDHMEVMFDLDTQAAEAAEAASLRMTRAGTVGTHPRFVEMVRELLMEQIAEGPRLHLGTSGPWPDMCPDGHCLAPTRPGPPGGVRGGQRP
jgi:ferrochelatase